MKLNFLLQLGFEHFTPFASMIELVVEEELIKKNSTIL